MVELVEASFGKHLDDVLGNTGDLLHVAAGSPLDPDTGGEFAAYDGLEHLPSGAGGGIH